MKNKEYVTITVGMNETRNTQYKKYDCMFNCNICKVTSYFRDWSKRYARGKRPDVDFSHAIDNLSFLIKGSRHEMLYDNFERAIELFKCIVEEAI